MLRIALIAMALAAASAAPASAAGPRIVSVDAGAPAVLDRALELRVTALERGEQVQGLRLSFPDLGGVFAESACAIGLTRARRAGAASDAFAVPYLPSFAGLHLLELAVTSGDCGAPGGTSRRSLPIEVAAEGVDPAVVGLGSGVVAGANCEGADALPLRPRLRSLRLTMVCLLNAERRAAGVAPLATSAALRRAAVAQVHDMRARAYVAHAGPGGPGLAARLRRAGVRSSVAGENLGVGPGRLGTPRSIVAAWMASDPLRRNLLDPRWRSVGVAALSTVPGLMRRSGGSYAVEFAS